MFESFQGINISLSPVDIVLISVIILLFIFLFIMYFNITFKEDMGFGRGIFSKNKIPVEMFEGGAPLNQGIGPYSNVKIQLPNGENFMRNPNNERLIPQDKMYVPQGTPLPLQASNAGQLFGSAGPSVDGTNNSPNSMFMFKYNQCKPECCPGTYSCSGGCVCSNKQQRDFVANRGGNRMFEEGF